MLNITSDRPEKIHKFLCELSEGYAQLNFKNDRLRKRFDGLKETIDIIPILHWKATRSSLSVSYVM